MSAESHVFGGLTLNAGDYSLIGHTFRPAQQSPDLIGGPDSEGALLIGEPEPEPMFHEMLIRVRQQPTAVLAQAKVGALVHRCNEAAKQPGGLEHVWTPQDTTTPFSIFVLFAQVVEVPMELSGPLYGWMDRSPVLKVQLVCKPFLYGVEVVGTPVTSVVMGAFFVTLANVLGTAPAEGRIILTDAAALAWRHVEWGLESRYLNAALSNTIAVGVTAYVASSPRIVYTSAALSHVGTFRVKAQISADTTSLRLRLAWRVGDGPYGTTAVGYVQVPSADVAYECDLGTVVIPPAVLGAQSWNLRIEAWSPIEGDSISISDLFLVPAGEGHGVARAAYVHQAGSVVQSDSFVSLAAAAALTGTSNGYGGGTWTGSGGTPDWTGVTLDGRAAVTRAYSGSTARRFMRRASAAAIDVGVKVRGTGTNWPVPSSSGDCLGVLARYVDASNYLWAGFGRETGNDLSLFINKVVGGSEQIIVSANLTVLGVPITADAWYELRLVAYASGFVALTLLTDDGLILRTIKSTSTQVATGGALATGGYGVVSALRTGVTHYLSEFYAATPNAEPVAINSGQSLEFRHDGCLREDSTGTTWGAPWNRGTRVLIPQSGYQNRPCRVLIKGSPADLEDSPQAGSVNLTAQVNYRPRYRMPSA